MAINIGIDFENITASQGNTALIAGIELIAKELKMLLNFPKYSLFFGNNMGLDLEKYMFLKNKQATFNLIKSDIEQLFAKYKRAYLKQIDMTFDNADNALMIDLTVSTDISGNNAFKIPLRVTN